MYEFISTNKNNYLQKNYLHFFGLSFFVSFKIIDTLIMM